MQRASVDHIQAKQVVYPRVRVREQKEEEDLTAQEEKRSLLLFKLFESLSLQDHCSSRISSVINTAKKHRNDSPPLIARVPQAYVRNGATPSITTSKGAVKNHKEIDEDTRPKNRASSVPRPRAVISSPDNDGMIGSINRLANQRSSNPKNLNSGQNTPIHGKIRGIQAESPINRSSGSVEAVEKTSCLNEKKGPKLTAPRQKAYLRKGKPSSVGI